MLKLISAKINLVKVMLFFEINTGQVLPQNYINSLSGEILIRANGYFDPKSDALLQL